MIDQHRVLLLGFGKEPAGQQRRSHHLEEIGANDVIAERRLIGTDHFAVDANIPIGIPGEQKIAGCCDADYARQRSNALAYLLGDTRAVRLGILLRFHSGGARG